MSLIFGTFLLGTCSLFFSQKANAVAAARQQLKACSVQSGGVITKIGDTCDSGGDGCTPNPCN